MDMKIALGQRLSIGFCGTELTDELKRILSTSKIGNIILFRRNIESFEQLYRLCSDLRNFIESETGHVPFIMLDEECGAVSRLAHIAGCTPCAMAIGETGDVENAYTVGRQIGRQLRAAGVNFNLAPVMDCFTHTGGIASGNRCFGSDPLKTADMGTAYIRGIRENGVLACSKHFPGAGSTSVDSHLALPVIDRTLEQFESLELIPFRRAIEAGTDAIMTAHIMLPKLEKESVPATLSRSIMTDLLRDRLGFKGILVSDSLEMQAVKDVYSFKASMTMALRAGVDIALICHAPAEAAEALAAQKTALESGLLAEDEIQKSLERIIRVKAGLAGPAGKREAFESPAYHASSLRILEKVIRVLPAADGRTLRHPGRTTVFTGFESFRASLAGDDIHYRAAEILTEHFGCMYWPEIPDEIPDDCGEVVLIMEYAGKPENMPYHVLADRLMERGIPVTVVSMFTPTVLDEFPDTVVKVCVWQYDALAVEALANLFADA
ncbi:MAG: beta-N-acetylhexosaminidase [Clostridia bacterium]|nr:beta-N-acetylhexosaminidase [Clostridia bacterium]